MTMKILVADDDSALRSLLCDILKKQGYEPIPAKDGEEAIDLYFESKNIELVILDVMMPKYTGFEVLEEVRKESNVPILMLTALGDEENEVNGLYGGANDYISKPFSYAILIARVEALLRHVKKTIDEDVLYGQLELRRSSHKVFLSNEEIKLNNKEYKLLDLLMSNIGVVMSREAILNSIWGYDYEGDSKTINTHIKMLRSKLKNCSNYIITVKGTGYLFEVKNENN